MPYLLYFYLHICAFFGASLPPVSRPSEPGAQQIASGHLPVVAADEQGTIHLVYGRDSVIYYATASGPSASFGQPVAVATLPNLVAGAKRGPQIAVTNSFIVVTAVNKIGDVFVYSLDRRTGKWGSAVRINDVPEIAKEGFQAVAGGTNGLFNCVWLDLRSDHANKIVGATSHNSGRSWSANRVIYRSPDGTVCECCRVSVAARGNKVYVQFRNWLGGSRDLYLTHSSDGGTTFNAPQKLGTGTWKVNACPMDGGAVALMPSGQPLTVWRRDTLLYSCQPGQPEQKLSAGRNITLGASPAGPVMSWDDGDAVWIQQPNQTPSLLGKGQMPSLAISGTRVTCVWENKGRVMTTTRTL